MRYEDRQQEKAARAKARAAAARLHPDVTIPLHANVQPCEGGFFVEASVWVPDHALNRHAQTCPAYGNYQPPYETCDCGVEND